MCCKQKKRKKRFLLCLLILIAAFNSPFPAQEKWIPDYNDRDTWQQPEKIMDILGVKPGMIITDVGAGKGYFTFKLALKI